MKTLTIWSLLVLTLPTENATARMRFWRTLKVKGCAVLRDGIYLLPHTEEREQMLRELAGAIADSGGTAHLLRAPSMLQSANATTQRRARSVDADRCGPRLRKVRRYRCAARVIRRKKRRRSLPERASAPFFSGCTVQFLTGYAYRYDTNVRHKRAGASERWLSMSGLYNENMRTR